MRCCYSCSERIKELGCQLFIDNYFNTPALHWNLLQRKVYCAGAVRMNRQSMPKPPKTLVPSNKDMKKSDMNCFAADNINFVRWMSSKGEHMLSNFFSAQPLYHVSQKQKGSSTKDIISSSNIRKQYNEHQCYGRCRHNGLKKMTHQFDHRLNTKYSIYHLRVVFNLYDI